MRSLVVTAVPPSNLTSDVHGGYKRIAMFIAAIARISTEIECLHLVPQAFFDDRHDLADLAWRQSEHWGVPITLTPVLTDRRTETYWKHYGAATLSIGSQKDFYPFAGAAQAAAIRAALGRHPDLVFLHTLASMSALLRMLDERPQALPPVFFDLCDVEHMVRLRAALAPPRWPGKLASVTQLPAIIAAERRAVALARQSFVCSERECAHLRRVGIRNVTAIPNSVELPARAPPPTADKTLMFLGAYNYAPNVSAAERLVNRIWPLVRDRIPEARLMIAGRDGERLPSAGRRPEGVVYRGFVPDLDALYAESRVICCPITQGTGTRLKLIEAASYARPMVSTRLGAEGLDFRPESEILLRDRDEDFAEACVRLLRDDALCARLGAAARARMTAQYDVAAIESRISDLMAPAVLTKQPVPV